MAGPYGTQLLAFLGADVIKVEEPGAGDPMRHLSKYYQGALSAHFMCGNANKRSVTLNLGHPEGRGLFLDLIRDSDVLVENFRPGTLERLGLDEATLRATNSSLVIASVTGFGKTGPWASWPAYDLIAQAAGGGMSLTGEPGRAPVKMGVPVGDLAAGLMAALGVVAALLGRERSGEADTVDVSMMDVQLSMLSYHSNFFFASGTAPGPEADGHPNIVPYKSFPAADGRIVVAVYGDRFWPGFCCALGLEDLQDHPDFVTNERRLANRHKLEEIITRTLQARPRAHWQARLVANGVPAAPIQGVGEALTSEQAVARGMVETVLDQRGEPLNLVGNPIKHTLPEPQVTAPPLLGQHTDAVLAALGCTPERIAALRAAGTI
jgi:crotonobetainyl-CoA:carnitine CoA-transferase CaiB-like acyl-CoA transferase